MDYKEVSTADLNAMLVFAKKERKQLTLDILYQRDNPESKNLLDIRSKFLTNVITVITDEINYRITKTFGV